MTKEVNPEEIEAAKKRIRSMTEKYEEKSGYKLNPDTGVVEDIIEGLAQRKIRYGFAYCPCRVVTGNKDEDRKIICPCIYHKEEIETGGVCHCGLFVAADYKQ